MISKERRLQGPRKRLYGNGSKTPPRDKKRRETQNKGRFSKLSEKILNFLLSPPKGIVVSLWILAILCLSLAGASLRGGGSVKMVVNLVGLISAEIYIGQLEVYAGDQKVSEVSIPVEIKNGKAYVGGEPLRDNWEKQGFTVVWDGENQRIVAIK